MEAPQMRGVEEPLLPEPRAVEGGATQSEGAIETQERRYPRLYKTAGLRGLDVWAEISRIVPEERIGRIGAPLATIEARQCYRPLRLATVQLPRGFLFLRPSTLMHERRGQTGSKT